MRTYRIAAALIASSLLASSCKKATPTESQATPASIDLALAGCAAVDREGRCELAGDGSLRVVLPADVRLVMATVDGKPLTDVRVEPIADGSIVHVSPHASPARLELTVNTPSGSRRSSRRIVRPREPSEVERDVAKARSAGNLDRAETLLAASLPSANPEQRAYLLDAKGRIAIGRGRRDDAIAALTEAAALHEKAGSVSRAANDRFALAFVLVRAHRFSELRALLPLARAAKSAWPEADEMAEYYEAMLARETGDLRGAIRSIRATIASADRLGMTHSSLQASALHAQLLAQLGRFVEARTLLSRTAERGTGTLSACEEGDIALDMGWFARQEREARGASNDDVEAAFKRAVAIYRERCKDADAIVNGETNLAWAALDKADFAEAKAALERAKAAGKQPRAKNAYEWAEIEGEIALGSGSKVDAERAAERFVALADAAADDDLRWRAAWLSARVSLVAGKSDRALERLAAAEKLAERLVGFVPVGEGRASSASFRARATKTFVGTLVRSHREPEALVATLRAARRTLASLDRQSRLESLPPAKRAQWEAAVGSYRDGRDALTRVAEHDWELAADALAEARNKRAEERARLARSLDDAFSLLLDPASEAGGLPTGSDDAPLLVLASTDRGDVAFVQRAKRITVFEAASAQKSAEEAATALLTLAVSELTAAKRIEVLPSARFASVDIARLAVDGAPFASRAPLSFIVPVGVRSNAVDEANQSPREITFVGDPRGDLPSARREAAALATMFGKTNTMTKLLLGEQATRAGVASELGGRDWVHYAGHGHYSGAEGLESYLELAGVDTLSASDVLALARVPKAIVLAGCETAVAIDDDGAEGLGLARAFVLAGSERVVAATRAVDDATTASLMTALYGELAGKQTLESAMQRAALRLHSEKPTADWTAFQLLTRGKAQP